MAGELHSGTQSGNRRSTQRSHPLFYHFRNSPAFPTCPSSFRLCGQFFFLPRNISCVKRILWQGKRHRRATRWPFSFFPSPPFSRFCEVFFLVQFTEHQEPFVFLAVNLLPLPPSSSSVGSCFLAALLRAWNPSIVRRSLSISCPQKPDSLFLNVQFFRVHGTFLPSAADRLPDPTEQGGEWVCIWIRISFEQHAGLTWRSIFFCATLTV